MQRGEDTNRSRPEDELDRFGAFRSAELEDIYRTQFFNTDRAVIRVAGAVSIVSLLALGVSDFHFLGGGWRFWLVFGLRIAVAVLVAGLVLTLPRQRNWRSLDRSIFVILMALAIFHITVDWSRPPDFFGYVIKDVCAIIMIFCLVPVPLRLQVPPTLLLIFGDAVCGLLMPSLGAIGGLGATALLGVCLSFAFGFYTSLQFNRQKRLLFLAGLLEGRLSRSLQDALVSLREREAEIARQADDLRASRDEAVRAGRAKAEFLANMSHEIRTPLNGILGFTRVLKERTLPPSERALVEGVSRSGALLLGIVNDILDFSKLESGHLQLSPAPLEVASLLREVLEMFAQAAAEKGVSLSGTVAESVSPWVEVDGNRLKQVLCNLVGNALKFTAQGLVALRIEPAAVGRSPIPGGEGATGRLHVSVRDTGIGISAEDMPRVFKKFSQVDGSATRQFGGTGLGLAISRALIERMDGRMWVDSEPGVGSTFHCEFAAPAVAASKAAVEFEVPVIPPLRILVAEDNTVNQEVIRQFLEVLGQDATIVDTGRKAVEAVERAVFDVVLMDMQMPEMDGIEATRRIRASTRDLAQRPRLISLSANVLQEHRAQMTEAGIDDILGKPVRFEALARILAECAAREP